MPKAFLRGGTIKVRPCALTDTIISLNTIFASRAVEVIGAVQAPDTVVVMGVAGVVAVFHRDGIRAARQYVLNITIIISNTICFCRVVRNRYIFRVFDDLDCGAPAVRVHVMIWNVA